MEPGGVFGCCAQGIAMFFKKPIKTSAILLPKELLVIIGSYTLNPVLFYRTVGVDMTRHVYRQAKEAVHRYCRLRYPPAFPRRGLDLTPAIRPTGEGIGTAFFRCKRHVVPFTRGRGIARLRITSAASEVRLVLGGCIVSIYDPQGPKLGEHPFFMISDEMVLPLAEYHHVVVESDEVVEGGYELFEVTPGQKAFYPVLTTWKTRVGPAGQLDYLGNSVRRVWIPAEAGADPHIVAGSVRLFPERDDASGWWVLDLGGSSVNPTSMGSVRLADKGAVADVLVQSDNALGVVSGMYGLAASQW